MDSDTYYKNKKIKYKRKYLELKNSLIQSGGDAVIYKCKDHINCKKYYNNDTFVVIVSDKLVAGFDILDDNIHKIIKIHIYIDDINIFYNGSNVIEFCKNDFEIKHFYDFIIKNSGNFTKDKEGKIKENYILDIKMHNLGLNKDLHNNTFYIYTDGCNYKSVEIKFGDNIEKIKVFNKSNDGKFHLSCLKKAIKTRYQPDIKTSDIKFYDSETLLICENDNDLIDITRKFTCIIDKNISDVIIDKNEIYLDYEKIHENLKFYKNVTYKHIHKLISLEKNIELIYNEYDYNNSIYCYFTNNFKPINVSINLKDNTHTINDIRVYCPVTFDNVFKPSVNKKIKYLKNTIQLYENLDEKSFKLLLNDKQITDDDELVEDSTYTIKIKFSVRVDKEIDGNQDERIQIYFEKENPDINDLITELKIRGNEYTILYHNYAKIKGNILLESNKTYNVSVSYLKIYKKMNGRPTLIDEKIVLDNDTPTIKNLLHSLYPHYKLETNDMLLANFEVIRYIDHDQMKEKSTSGTKITSIDYKLDKSKIYVIEYIGNITFFSDNKSTTLRSPTKSTAYPTSIEYNKKIGEKSPPLATHSMTGSN